ncbi:MAG: glycosyltransferase [Muribaculaceae bacterium]|nr:glycosyltransferase [Muribaculaceae bacterium]
MISLEVLSQIQHIKERCAEIKPLVAIKCITYNQELYLRDALEGFVMQKTDFPFVALVHDDASTDTTTKILKEYAEKYPNIIFPIYETENQHSKHDGSLDKILFSALEATKAKYIALCEGDDYWIDPLKLQKQVSFLQSHSEYGMVYAIAKRYSQEKKEFMEPMGRPYKDIEEMLLESYQVPTASILYRADIYKEIYNKYIKGKNWLMGDYPLSLGFMTISKIKFIPEEMSVYRILSNSACHFTSFDKLERFCKSSYEVEKFYASLNKLNILNKLEENFNTSLYFKSLSYPNKVISYNYYKKIKPKSLKEKCKRILCSSYYSYIVFQKINNFRLKLIK